VSPAPRAPRIVVMSGICTRHDAISNVVRTQEQMLVDAGYDVRVYVQHTDFPGGRHVAVSDAWLLQRDEWYASADLVILHFGIRYSLFDSLGLSHRGRRVVHFHNVTPPDLLTGTARHAAVAGIDQASIASLADEVWSDSEYNTRCLLEWTDVDPRRVRPMQLCTPWADTDHVVPDVDALDRAAAADPRVPAARERVIAVGRLLPAKGQLDLVDAVGRLDAGRREGLEVDLIGVTDASDADYLAELRRRIDELDLDDVVRVELDLPDADLVERYRQADVFVSTSRHEGFCVPVIEAIASGCRVVTTDAGALPETVGQCGQLVPVGDVDALTEALRAALDAGPPGIDEATARHEHLRTFSNDGFRSRLLDAVEVLLADGPVNAAAEGAR
jgi:glycosyltransferase involved in cell wall biosynthesis